MYQVDYIIRELAASVSNMDARFSLLRAIDREIVDSKKPLPDVMAEVCVGMKDIFHSSRVGAYLVSNNKLKPFDIPLKHNEIGIYIPQKITQPIPDTVTFFDKGWPVEGDAGTLVIPIKWGDKVFSVLILQDDIPSRSSNLRERDVIEYCGGVANQLAIFVRRNIDGRIEQRHQNLINAYFDNQLQTSECWSAIATALVDFLPTWEPASLPDRPHFQLLTYTPGNRYLNLCADDGDAGNKPFNSIPIRVDQTICGILIEKCQTGEAVDHILVNPRDKDYASRYQSYLFDGDIPQSELVIAIRHEGEICGVINVEHSAENVILQIHIDILHVAARYIGPFVSAIVAREQRHRAQVISMLYVQGRLLKRMASLYRHKVGHCLIQSRFAMENLEAAIADVREVDVKPIISELRDTIDQFQERSNVFMTDLTKYIYYDEIDVVAAVKSAISEFELTSQKEKITIEFFNHCDGPCIAWASQLLREHIYNLLHNAVDAIRELVSASKIDIGHIEVTIIKSAVTDRQRKETGPSQISIIIVDNGGGAPKDKEDSILDFGVTTKEDRGGTGYGLPAAKEYAQSLGGNLFFVNVPGQGFSVTVTLQEYTSDYHDQLKQNMRAPTAFSGGKK